MSAARRGARRGEGLGGSPSRGGWMTASQCAQRSVNVAHGAVIWRSQPPQLTTSSASKRGVSAETVTIDGGRPRGICERPLGRAFAAFETCVALYTLRRPDGRVTCKEPSAALTHASR